MTKKELRDKIKQYKELKADIEEINISMEELEDEMGVSGMSIEEKTGKTYKINSNTEIQALNYIKRKEDLIKQKKKLLREIRKIDNALTILSEEERMIIEIALIQNKPYYTIQDRLRLTYKRVNQIEGEALRKMEKYIN